MIMDLARIMIWLILDQVNWALWCVVCVRQNSTHGGMCRWNRLSVFFLISWAGIYLIIGTLVKLESTVIIVFRGLTACLKACAEILFYEGVIRWLYALFKDSHLYIWTLLPLQYLSNAQCHFWIRPILYRAGMHLNGLIILSFTPLRVISNPFNATKGEFLNNNLGIFSI